jgi:hypothetical protein
MSGALTIAIVMPRWPPTAKTPAHNVVTASQPTVVEARR